MTDRREKPKSKFPDHRGLATWGDRLVRLDEFARATATHGRRLDDARRAADVRAFHAERFDDTPVEGPFGRVAVFGTSSKMKNSASGPKYAASAMPVERRYSSALSPMCRGSREYGERVIVSATSQITVSVGNSREEVGS